MKKFFCCFLITTFFFFSANSQVPISKPSDPLPANAFIELAKIVNPAVVNISTKVLPKKMNRGQRDPFFDMLEQFYGLQMQPQQARPQTALGTGFIIREDGLIVTNNHVIQGADEIDVQLAGETKNLHRAKVIGSDERTDIALIKIEGKSFPKLAMGSSSDTQVGEWVAAFGNPYGQGHTMTKGIISAKGRDISEINRFPLLQTDAPINPGNSGGPLVNLRGQVIGVNSAIDPRAQGIGFAIPIDEVKAILPQLEKLGRIRKGYIGVGLANLDPRAAQALGYKNLEGAVIAEVEKNGPADKGGIKPYDVVTNVNGKDIKSAADLSDAIAGASIGSNVQIKVAREGKEKNLTVTVAERPDRNRPKETPFFKKQYGQKAPFELGFEIADANDQLRKEFELPKDIRKPIIVSVEARSKAAQSGLLPGDVILDVNRTEVNSTGDVTRNLKKGTNTLRLFRDGSVIFLMLEAT
jgi:serine protease Do